MTELMKDILRQPDELLNLLKYASGKGSPPFERAARLIREAQQLYITGIGSSWHAGMAIQALFDSAGRPACLLDASEFLHFTQIAPNSAVLLLSRSGRSIEIVNLLSKAKEAGARLIGITNSPESPLAREAEVTLQLDAHFDHFVSVVMYSGVALCGALLASCVLNRVNEALFQSLAESLSGVKEAIYDWSSRIEESDWLAKDSPTYFLARGASRASCHEARLLWEEASKAPATAMTSGGFRHGSQEIIVDGFRFGVWIDGEKMRGQDLAMAADIRELGGKVMLIGQDLSSNDADLVLCLPRIQSDWQFLIDIIPAQLAAEHLSHLRRVNCDSLRICSYIVESEAGLITDPTGGGRSIARG